MFRISKLLFCAIGSFVYRNWVVLSVECGCYESEGALLVLLERYQVYGELQVVFGWNLIAIQT